MNYETDVNGARRLQNFGIICKIWFGDESGVYNKKEYPLEEDYRELMRTGKWKSSHGCSGGNKFEWGTPRPYMAGGRTKLLLYDKIEKAITVDATVKQDEYYYCDDDCNEEEEFCFKHRNIIDEGRLKVLDIVIPLETIRKLPGFNKFGAKGDRVAFRVISEQDYALLLR